MIIQHFINLQPGGKDWLVELAMTALVRTVYICLTVLIINEDQGAWRGPAMPMWL